MRWLVSANFPQYSGPFLYFMGGSLYHKIQKADKIEKSAEKVKKRLAILCFRCYYTDKPKETPEAEAKGSGKTPTEEREVFQDDEAGKDRGREGIPQPAEG